MTVKWPTGSSTRQNSNSKTHDSPSDRDQSESVRCHCALSGQEPRRPQAAGWDCSFLPCQAFSRPGCHNQIGIHIECYPDVGRLVVFPSQQHKTAALFHKSMQTSVGCYCSALEQSCDCWTWPVQWGVLRLGNISSTMRKKQTWNASTIHPILMNFRRFLWLWILY